MQSWYGGGEGRMKGSRPLVSPQGKLNKGHVTFKFPQKSISFRRLFNYIF
jgi:ribosomal protein L2